MFIRFALYEKGPKLHYGHTVNTVKPVLKGHPREEQKVATP